MYDILLLANSVIVVDRYYNDFSLLNVWDSKEVFIVIRNKENIQLKTIRELEVLDHKHHHIPKKLRRVMIWKDDNIQKIGLITNQISWIKNTIREFYKS